MTKEGGSMSYDVLDAREMRMKNNDGETGGRNMKIFFTDEEWKSVQWLMRKEIAHECSDAIYNEICDNILMLNQFYDERKTLRDNIVKIITGEK